MNFSPRKKIGAISLVIVLAILIARCSSDGRSMSAPKPEQDQTIAVPSTIASVVAAPQSSIFGITGLWVEGQPISAKYTCAGESISPPLQFNGIPAGTVTLGFVLTNQDENGDILWAVANIPVSETNFVEGTLPNGAIEATSSDGTIGYLAPCPPAGQSNHYLMTAYAVAQQLELTDGVDAVTLQAALDAGALAVAESAFTAETP
ncbi:MAG: YbhB/YbcL family Raf kinase inhibitor-like protein [Ilumatobacteraceae bacterium]